MGKVEIRDSHYPRFALPKNQKQFECCLRTHTYEKAAFGVALKKCNTKHYIALCYISPFHYFSHKKVPPHIIHQFIIAQFIKSLLSSQELSWQANFTFLNRKICRI